MGLNLTQPHTSHFKVSFIPQLHIIYYDMNGISIIEQHKQSCI